MVVQISKQRIMKILVRCKYVTQKLLINNYEAGQMLSKNSSTGRLFQIIII
jgi:hypothetical protein